MWNRRRPNDCETYSQFHQHVYVQLLQIRADPKSTKRLSNSSTFYPHLFCWYFCAKKLQSQNVTREKLHKTLLYKKFAGKMLMKLITGRWCIFALLGFGSVKAARRTLVKLTLGFVPSGWVPHTSSVCW